MPNVSQEISNDEQNRRFKVLTRSASSLIVAIPLIEDAGRKKRS
jgi:hypothetical protein